MKKTGEQIELKPCPFCGSEASVATGMGAYGECRKCGAAGPVRHDVRQASEAWNKRADGKLVAQAAEPIRCPKCGKKVETSSTDACRRVRFPGICAFARIYGYNYTSVYKHLTGERPSRKMAARWQSWSARKGVAV